jgi:hypothetical protein
LGTTTLPGSKFNGKSNGLNFGNGGIAVTFAGLTVGGNVIGGRINGQLAPVPQGGANEFAYLLGAKYVTGPLTVGIVGETGWYQGNVNLAGLSQRRGRAIDTGLSYTVAPGFIVFAEYVYQEVKQNGFNFVTSATNAVGSGFGTNSNIHSQGFMIGNTIAF